MATNTIDASSLQNTQDPLKLPVVTPDNGAESAATIQSAFGNVQNLIEQQTAQENSLNSSNNAILNVQSQIAGLDPLKAQMEQQANIQQQKQSVLDASNQLNTLATQANIIPLTYEGQTGGERTRGGNQVMQTADLRRNAIQALTISADLAAKQGNLALAQSNIDKSIELKNQALTNELNIRKQAYEMNKEALERVDKKRADALGYAIKKQETALAEKKKNEADIATMITEAIPNAPTNVIANAKKLAESGASKLAVAQALGVYGGDYLKNELLREQLKQARVKTSTISTDGRELVTQNGVQLVKVTPKEIQDLNDTQIAKNSLVSLVDNMINSVDKFGTQVLFGKEAGTRSGAKTNLLLAMKNLEKTGALDKGTIDVLSGTIPESEFFATEAAQKAALQQLRDTVVNKTDEYINSYKGTTAETDPRTKRIYEQSGFVSTGNPQADEYIKKSMGAVSSVNTSMTTPNAINAGYIDNQK